MAPETITTPTQSGPIQEQETTREHAITITPPLQEPTITTTAVLVTIQTRQPEATTATHPPVPIHLQPVGAAEVTTAEVDVPRLVAEEDKKNNNYNTYVPDNLSA